MTVKRGFQRIASVVIAIATPVVGYLAYVSSDYRAGFAPSLVSADSPLDREAATVYLVDDVGALYFQSYVSSAEAEAHLKTVVPYARAVRLPNADRRRSIKSFADGLRSEYPQYSKEDDTSFVQEVLTKAPFRRAEVNFVEIRVDEVRAKRPLWAAGVTVAVVVALSGVLFGGIWVFDWIVRGFRDTSSDRAA
jgi:hypothetical protein